MPILSKNYLKILDMKDKIEPDKALEKLKIFGIRRHPDMPKTKSRTWFLTKRNSKKHKVTLTKI